MIKVTVLYGHPVNAESFEKYYNDTHTPSVAKVNGIAKAEYAKFLSNPDGTAPAYYRMAEIYFAGKDEMQQSMSLPEGQAMVADVPNFATVV